MRDASVKRVARQHHDEDDALQHQHRSVRQAEAALQQAAAGADAAEQDGDRNDGKRIVPRQERHQDAGVAVADRQIGVGASLHRGNLDHAGETGRGAGEKAGDEDEPPDVETDHLGGADVAAGDPRRKSEHGVIDQDIGEDRGNDAERKAPVHVGAGNAADHVGGADLRASTAC